MSWVLTLRPRPPLSDTADFIDSADQVPENRKRAEDLLDEAEALLAGQPEGNQNRWLFREYSVADCCMTQLVAMLRLLDIMSFDGRPNLKQVGGGLGPRLGFGNPVRLGVPSKPPSPSRPCLTRPPSFSFSPSFGRPRRKDPVTRRQA